jgi:plasmid stabilization system protein ParE
MKEKRQPATWQVTHSKLADSDIKEIVRFILKREGPGMAKTMLHRLLTAKENLSTLPGRNRIPPELERINIYTFREILIGPYRMIYEIRENENTVYVHMVVDGRRDLPDLLTGRLLGLGAGDVPDASL